MPNVSAAALVVRVIVSLGVVLAVMAGAAALLRRNGVPGAISGRRGAGSRRPAARIEVIARHGLGRGASVAVVRIGGKGFVLGVTEQQVSLLAEADPAELEGEPASPGLPTPQADAAGTPLSGSWRRTLGGVTPRPSSPGSASSAWKAVLETMRDRTARTGGHPRPRRSS